MDKRLTEAQLLDLVGRYAVQRDVIDSVFRPDELANLHSVILPCVRGTAKHWVLRYPSFSTRLALSRKMFLCAAPFGASRRIVAIVCAPWHFSPCPALSLQSLP